MSYQCYDFAEEEQLSLAPREFVEEEVVPLSTMFRNLLGKTKLKDI